MIGKRCSPDDILTEYSKLLTFTNVRLGLYQTEFQRTNNKKQLHTHLKLKLIMNPSYYSPRCPLLSQFKLQESYSQQTNPKRPKCQKNRQLMLR